MVLLVAGAILSYLTMVWLMEAANRTGKNNYAHIVEEILGPKAGILLHLMFIMMTFGCVTLYLITTAQFVPKIFIQFGMEPNLAESWGIRALIIISIVVFLMPIALQR